jgi:DHA2 family multidrug resistance protein-like MFS transporter
MTAGSGDQAGAAAAEKGGLPPRRRAIAVTATLLSVLMSVLLGSIVNLALPTMADALGATPDQVVWVVTAYQLALLVALLPFGSLGEILGYHKVFLAGLAGMIATSVVCALADSLPLLVAMRGVQGIAAAAVMSVTGALLRYAYPPNALGRAIGLNAMVVALGGTLGPGIGALVLSFGSWHWVFAVTVPPALLAGALGMATLPRVEGASRRFDATGTALNALTFGLLFIGVDRLFSAPGTGIALLAGSALAMWRLVRHQRGQQQPLLPLDLLALPSMGIALAGSVSGFAAQMLALVALPFLMHGAWQMSTAQSGALLLLWPLAVGALAPVAGRLSDRVDTALLCAAGSGALGLALLLLALVPGGAAPVLAGAGIAACGLAFGLFQTPNARAILSSAPIARSGGAGAMQATARQLGQGAGTLTAAAIFKLLPGTAPVASLKLAAALAALSCLLSLARWWRGTR